MNTFLSSAYQMVKNIFSVSFFSSPDMHQSITRLECQAMDKGSSLIFAFWASRF